MSHRPEHSPEGDPCTRLWNGLPCGLPPERHRKRRRAPVPTFSPAPRPDAAKLPRAPRKRSPNRSSRPLRLPAPDPNDETIVAIDGEGEGRFPHRYTYLAAVDEYGTLQGEIRNRMGLGTTECLDFFLSLGVKRVFGFSIGYDLTKILADLPDKHLYLLNRPKKREYVEESGRIGQRPVDWRGYRFAYLRGRLMVWRIKWDPRLDRNVKVSDAVTIWDVFRFFQSKFTTALLDWKVATADKLERMMRMKNQRADFNKLTSEEVESYCKEECQYLALLVRKLIEAHTAVGLRLKGFWGAGATATALLNKLEIKDHIEFPPIEMKHAVACGFFGGRFEISHTGPITGPVYNYDISSAYPYHITHLPCLAHGKWERVTGKSLDARIQRARLALVHLKVLRARGQPDAWGPFPFRTTEGTILFPRENEGAWVWQDEYQAAQRIFPGIRPTEAWVFESTCSHQPFETLPEIYRERVRIGKEGAGIVLKLGPNSIYGKAAQTLGTPKFQSFVWAGVITSNTRAQLLSAFEGISQDEYWDLLMFATDGIFSRRELALPAPRDTGTTALPNEKGEIVHKPLGGWEMKKYEKGIFLLRPGIYFPLDPAPDEITKVKARGMSQGVLFEHSKRIVEHWHAHQGEACVPDYVVHGFEGDAKTCTRCGEQQNGHPKGVERFVGMKTGVLQAGKKPPKRSEDYGEWIAYPIVSGFSPLPKRARVMANQRLESFARMRGESESYKRANLAPETLALRASEEIFSDQPDGDFSEAP